jgi:hypothetical protein
MSPHVRKCMYINSLNAELNPICHLLVLLGDLTFMGPWFLSIFQYISNKMQRYTLYLYLETALHVSGGISTHHQERIQLYLQHLVFVTTLLLSAAIVEELEPVWVCCGWRTPLLPPRSNVKPEAATAVYKLLIMGERMPETCWAVFERRAINLRDWCAWLADLFECMMMHGLTNS